LVGLQRADLELHSLLLALTPTAPGPAARPATGRRSSSPRRPRGMRRPRSPVGDVGSLPAAARLTVLAERVQIVLAVLARRLVLIRVTPRIERHYLLQVGPVPFRLALRPHDQRREPLLGGRVVPHVQPIGVERALEGADLRLRRPHFRLPELREIT